MLKNSNNSRYARSSYNRFNLCFLTLLIILINIGLVTARSRGYGDAIATYIHRVKIPLHTYAKSQYMNMNAICTIIPALIKYKNTCKMVSDYDKYGNMNK